MVDPQRTDVTLNYGNPRSALVKNKIQISQILTLHKQKIWLIDKIPLICIRLPLKSNEESCIQK